MKWMKEHTVLIRTFMLLALFGMLLAGCAAPGPTPPPETATPAITLTPTPTPSVTPLVVFPGTEGAEMEVTSTPGPIPEPAQAAVVPLPENIRVLLLAGQDRDAPYVGRTDALMLVFYDPLQARAGVISLPPDMLASIPGFGAGRLNTAYALGGAQTLVNAITHNFGVTPDHYAVFNADSFVKFIDQLGGIPHTIDDPLVKKCTSAAPDGKVRLKGTEVLCIFKFRSGPDEVARNKRQGMVLKAIFNALVRNGNLVRVPDLADSYSQVVDSDLLYRDLVSFIPLALQVGDINRFKIYTLPQDSLSYQSFGPSPDSVFLMPQADAYFTLISRVGNEVSKPMPFSTYLPTLQQMLVASPTATSTPRPTWTMKPSITPTRTITPTLTSTPTILPTWGSN